MAVSAGQPTNRICLSTYELGFGTKKPALPSLAAVLVKAAPGALLAQYQR